MPFPEALRSYDPMITRKQLNARRIKLKKLNYSPKKIYKNKQRKTIPTTNRRVHVMNERLTTRRLHMISAGLRRRTIPMMRAQRTKRRVPTMSAGLTRRVSIMSAPLTGIVLSKQAMSNYAP